MVGLFFGNFVNLAPAASLGPIWAKKLTTFYKQRRNTARNVKISTYTNFRALNSMVGLFFRNSANLAPRSIIRPNLGKKWSTFYKQ